MEGGFDFSDDSDEKPFDIKIDGTHSKHNSISLSQRNNELNSSRQNFLSVNSPKESSRVMMS